eukprot:Seg3698.4 transcript_id=Seg3698.4/GoldUCD/mRNA.D3Y31 product="Dopamine D1 receptor" protein_id=Seg3698.4/GoldUCD/D3Y31
MHISLAERVIFAIYFSFLGLFGLVANTGILVVLLKSKDYRKRPSTYYLYSVLISSILACTTEIPYYLISVTARLPPPKDNIYKAECRATLFFTYSISTIKVFVLAGMSLDRFIAVLYPYFYNAHMTKLKVAIINVSLWIAATALMLHLSVTDGPGRYLGTFGLSCGVDWQFVSKAYTMCTMFVGFFLPAIIMVITNMKVFIVARKQKSLIKNERVRHQTRETETSPGNLDSNLTTFYTRQPETIVIQNDKLPHRKKHPSIFYGPSKWNVCPSRGSETSTCNKKKKHGALGNPKGNLSNALSLEILEANDLDTVEHIKIKSEFNSSKLTDTRDDSVHFEKSTVPMENSHKQSLINEIAGNDAKTKTSQDDKQAADSPNAKVMWTKVRHRNGIEWSIVGSTLLLVAAFFIAWSPFVITRLIESFVRILASKLAVYTTSLTLLDIFINPLIIIGTRKTFRKKFLKIFPCKT